MARPTANSARCPVAKRAATMTPSPTIRLFVSSTFSDLKAERDALQREVFPRLKQFCLSKGLRFQAIDLRWGISEEAGRDNRTLRICLRELRRCQQDRRKPVEAVEFQREHDALAAQLAAKKNA